MWAKAPHLHIYIEKPYSLLYMPWYFMYVTPHLKYRSCLGLSTTFFSIIFALTFSVFKCHYFLTGEMLKLCSYTHTHTHIYICVCVCLCLWGWVRRRGCIGSWWGNWSEGDHCGDLGVDGWIILGWVSRRWDMGIWTGLGWPRIETGRGRLWVR